jgi:hypothetical protein
MPQETTPGGAFQLVSPQQEEVVAEECNLIVFHN